MPWPERYPSLPYVAPFAVFMLFLTIHPYNPLPERIEYPLRLVILGAVLWFASRDVISSRISNFGGSLLLGVAVFVIWVAPDFLVPGWRQHWLFQNSFTGTLKSSLSDAARDDVFILTLRSLRAVVIVPIIEELFWRAWMMRWIIDPNFRTIALGAFTAASFWLTALLFGSEHGSYWDVGLLAGVAYNWWMLRTRSLGDCILAHAVTNACLSVFVMVTGKWEYWL